ncbi:hypothetical protein BDN70DRAFT_532519 [Pholiota conissans]|uniref:Uncharacterized protein n=1 Tax=Pholiota conissans TaxID=109636 RepID=A0A9P5ZCL1_9AGAR|nr:hypothetical protein BDN70DRAFT_532519 [Pholiota conissans]
MLLKLIPASQEPTIHFSLSFAELPSTLPTPSAWTAQLSHLMHEDLEVPATLHSLDRAAGIPSLLEEVTLDVERKEIRCRYVDGSYEMIAFGLRGPRNEQRLKDALASIVRDVRESTLEDERVMKAREWERQRTRSASVSAASALPSKTGRQGKHKKQRSLFMHIVSCVGSIINITSPSTSTHPSLPFYARPNSSRSSTSTLPATAMADGPSSNTPNTPMVPTPGSSPKARALRRAARSALVDAFRHFVLSELVRRFYAGSNTRFSTGQEVGPQMYTYTLENHHRRERGGFCVWILHSMRRRALERMDLILEEAGPPPPEERRRFSEEVIPGFCPTTMDVPSSFSDEEDEEPMVESPISMGEASKFPLDAELDMMEREADENLAWSMSDKQPEGYPKRPSINPRRASTASVSTEDSSESGSTSRSTSSMSTVSTAPSSVESEPDVKEELSPSPPAKDVPLSMYRPQYSSHHVLGSNIRHLSPKAKNEYTQLYDLRTRLGQLVQFAASQSRVAADEVRNRLDVLAVRSRRRAWLNKALKGPLIQAGVAGGSMFGLATPFRSSPLARYMFSADDLARRSSPISGSTCSSTSSLSSAYFRTVSSVSSSASSVSASSLSKSTSPFPTSRPRIRPKIDYSATFAAAIVDCVGPETSDGNAYGNEVGPDGAEIKGLTTTTVDCCSSSLKKLRVHHVQGGIIEELTKRLFCLRDPLSLRRLRVVNSSRSARNWIIRTMNSL